MTQDRVTARRRRERCSPHAQMLRARAAQKRTFGVRQGGVAPRAGFGDLAVCMAGPGGCAVRPCRRPRACCAARWRARCSGRSRSRCRPARTGRFLLLRCRRCRPGTAVVLSAPRAWLRSPLFQRDSVDHHQRHGAPDGASRGLLLLTRVCPGSGAGRRLGGRVYAPGGVRSRRAPTRRTCSRSRARLHSRPHLPMSERSFWTRLPVERDCEDGLHWICSPYELDADFVFESESLWAFCSNCLH